MKFEYEKVLGYFLLLFDVFSVQQFILIAFAKYSDLFHFKQADIAEVTWGKFRGEKIKVLFQWQYDLKHMRLMPCDKWSSLSHFENTQFSKIFFLHDTWPQTHLTFYTHRTLTQDFPSIAMWQTGQYNIKSFCLISNCHETSLSMSKTFWRKGFLCLIKWYSQLSRLLQDIWFVFSVRMHYNILTGR